MDQLLTSRVWLALYLIVTGAVLILHLSMDALTIIEGILALGAGLLMIAGR